jgi:hypothetical protein
LALIIATEDYGNLSVTLQIGKVAVRRRERFGDKGLGG